MSPEILSFLGSFVVGMLSLVGIVYSTNSTRKVYEAVNDEKLKAISIQIKSLEEKQDKHNSIIERQYASEKKQTSMEKDIETLQGDIKEVRGDIQDIKNDVNDVREDLHKLQLQETQIEGKLQK